MATRWTVHASTYTPGLCSDVVEAGSTLFSFLEAASP